MTKSVPLGDLVTAANVERAGDADLPVLSMTRSRGLVLQDGVFNKTVASRDLCKYKVVRPLQLVVGIHIDEGALGVSGNEQRGIVSPAYTLWDLTALDQVDPIYLHRFIRSPRAVGYFGANYRQTAERRGKITREQFLALQVPLPPLSEQRRIAAILDKADAICRKRQEALRLADEFLRSSFIGHYLSKKGQHIEFPFLELAKTERNSFVNGPFGSNLLKSELKSSGVPVIYIRDIRDQQYRRISTVYVSEHKADQLSACSVFPGDVLIAKVGDPPGTAAIYPDHLPNGVVTQDVIRIRVDKAKCEPAYLKMFMNSPFGINLLRPITVQATRSRIGLGPLKKQTVYLPSISEQQMFVRVYQKVTSLRQKSENTLYQSQKMFASITQRAFCGKLLG